MLADFAHAGPAGVGFSIATVSTYTIHVGELGTKRFRVLRKVRSLDLREARTIDVSL